MVHLRETPNVLLALVLGKMGKMVVFSSCLKLHQLHGTVYYQHYNKSQALHHSDVTKKLYCFSGRF